MESVRAFLHVLIEIIDVLAVIVLVFGFLKIFIKYVALEVRKLSHTPFKALQKIRCEMGIYILLGLDFLIVSDIIQTILDLNMTELIKLSALIVLRTIISYFLGKEIVEIESIHDESENENKKN